MMHKESPPAKNSFLEDLDKLEVSGSKKNTEQFYGMCHMKLGSRSSVCLLLVYMEVQHILLLK